MHQMGPQLLHFNSVAHGNEQLPNRQIQNRKRQRSDLSNEVHRL